MTDKLCLPVDYIRRGPNCGIVAIAIVAGISYERAWHAVRDVRGIRRGWRGSTSRLMREEVLTNLGVSFTSIKIPYCMSLKTWVMWYSEPDTMYMVNTTGHVQVVLDQYVIDQCQKRHVSAFHWRNKRVLDVIAIGNINVPVEQWEDIAVL